MIEGHYRRGTYTHETSTAAAVVIRAKAVLVFGAIIVALFMMNSATSVVGIGVLVVLGAIVLALLTIVGLGALWLVQGGIKRSSVAPHERRSISHVRRPDELYSTADAGNDLRWTSEAVRVERYR